MSLKASARVAINRVGIGSPASRKTVKCQLEQLFLSEHRIGLVAARMEMQLRCERLGSVLQFH